MGVKRAFIWKVSDVQMGLHRNQFFKPLVVLLLLLTSRASFAQSHSEHEGQMPEMAANQNSQNSKPQAHPMGPRDCSEMEVWDYFMGMCMPLAMKDMPMKMLMLHGNAFIVQTSEEGPRGRNALSSANMAMLDYGTSAFDRHYFNIDLMMTLEKWTFPKDGYPELLQIGEENEDHKPYLDAQHPHSSPIMGLTFSDTISLGHDKDHLKVFFAPRGQATDGPIAFMHRQTGMQNPDAPLGHHIGQDVGHITSTVIGASLRKSDSTFEVSTFNGTEPEPSKVDLPLGTPNSFAARVTEQFSDSTYAMASAAFVKNPEPNEPELDHIWRYSASLYNDHQFDNGWMFHNAFIWGLVNFYDGASALNAFNEEFWFHKSRSSIWGRIEHLQRTAFELQIIPAANDPKWVTAATLGYTHKFATWENLEIGLGASVTKDFLPGEFQAAYGGNPLSGKAFLQVGGMKMWDLGQQSTHHKEM
jgi:hypothetical protein